VNIVTVEDPVEYRLQGIVQVQVNEKAGLTFPAALRSILRQDPDVILVGEIRDKETANIAVQASLTGHLVLSTLHTNDAASSVTRLVDIGIESYKIAAALKGVVAQRLMRRCVRTAASSRWARCPRSLHRFFPDQGTLYRAVGCPECSMTGYRGRLAIEESPARHRRGRASHRGQRERGAHQRRRARGGHALPVGVGRAARAEGRDDRSRSCSACSRPRRNRARSLRSQRRRDREPNAVRPPTRGRAQQVARTRQGSASGPPRPRAAAARVTPRPGHLHRRVVRTRGGGQAKKPAAKRVLLVEDEESLRRVMKDLLEREGFVVFEAADGVVALDEVDRLAPDLVVLDLNLPRLDGYGVLSHLRARPATQKLPVIVLTAKGDEDSEVRVFEYGASDYLTKPFRARALSARIHSCSNARRGPRRSACGPDRGRGVVDVLVFRPRPRDGRRSRCSAPPDTRCPGTWEMVHGKVEPGESLEAAARRELHEETGLVPRSASSR
jgi:CheY-like chemotaxis protein